MKTRRSDATQTFETLRYANTTAFRWFLLPFLAIALAVKSPAQGGPPNILIQPQSQTNMVGTSAQFSVLVSGITGLTYQWRFNGSNIVAATTSAYTIPAIPGVQYPNAGNFSVALTNAVGYTISSNALLTVLGPPAITGQPANTNKQEGQTATFSVGVVGPTPMSYQWRYFGTNNILNATNSGLTIPNAQIWHAGRYSVVVTNIYGAVTSNPNVTLTMTLNPWMIGCWGKTTNGESTVPVSPVGGYRAIAAGGIHSVALRDNGVALAWGDNFFGQTNAPISIFDGIAVAAGYFHSLLLRSNGTVFAWGNNTNGQCNAPFDLTNCTSIAAGALHSLALRSDGTVTAWGANNFGQAQVPPGLGDVVQIAAGYYHNLALKRDGSIVGWGNNSSGEISPPPGITGVVAVSAGNGFSLALRTNGAIVAWGANNFGQTNVPTSLATNSGAVAISAGGFHSLALIRNGGAQGGSIVGWGQNNFGETNNLSSLTGISGIAAGAYHNLALKSDNVPFINTQPVSQRVGVGADVPFNAMVVGLLPMAYQWRFNGTNIAGATTNNFVLSSAQLTNAGQYSIVITNTLGSVTSSPAMLVVDSGFKLTALGPVPGGFVVRLTAQPGVYVIQVSANLSGWVDVLTTNVPPAGFIDLLDPTTAAIGRRFYRAHLP